MSSRSQQERNSDDVLGLDPNDAEISAWAAHERERRESWRRGPTQAEKAEWAASERARRLAEGSARQRRLPGPSGDLRWLALRFGREAQLAAEGAMSLLLSVSARDVFDELIRAGREWEEEYVSSPPQRRRVRLSPDTSEIDAGSRSPGTSPSSS